MKKKENTKQKNGIIGRIVTVIVVIAVIALAAAGLWYLSGEGNKPADQLVFTVGEEEVYLDEINLCILQNVVNLQITAKSLQETTAEDGSNAADYYKNEILELIMDYKVEYMIAKEQGIQLTKEEKKSVLSDAVTYMGKIDARILNNLGITQECIEKVYEQRYLAHKLEETVISEVEVEEQNYCTMYLMLFPKIQTDENGDYITEDDDETPIMLSEEEIQSRKEDADAAYQKLIAGESVEAVAKEFGVEAFSGEESNMVESFSEPFVKYAKSLKNGEYSPVLDVESCYAIVKMVESNDQDFADKVMEYYRADLEEEAVEEKKKEWYEQAGVKDEPEYKGTIWKNLTLYDYVQ